MRWSRDAVRLRRLRIDPFLATPAAGATWEIPVIVFAYIPTADASLIDVRKAPDFWALLPFSLDTMEQRVLDFARRVKMCREQGSRFRGYKDLLAPPSLGIRIVEYVIVYDIIPASTKREPRSAGQPFFPDYFKVFAELQLTPIMQARQVKEVWDAWTGFDAGYPSYDPAIHIPADFRFG